MKYLLILSILIPSSIFSQNQFHDLNNIYTDHAITDLKYLVETIETVHFNPFLHHSKEIWEKQKKEILNSWSKQDSISSSDFTLQMMELLALTNCGHTNLKWYSSKLIPDKKSNLFFPLVIESNKDGQLNYSDNPTTLLKINGKDAQKLYQSALKRLGGNMNYKQQLTRDIFFSVYLYLAEIHAPFVLEFEDGQSLTVYEEDCINFLDLWKQLKGDQKDYYFKILEDKVGYIAYNNCNDYDRFNTFLKETFMTIQESNIQRLIIDIRKNSGGDSSLNDLLLSYLTTKPYRQMSRRLWKYSTASEKTLINQGYRDYFGENFIQEARISEGSSILEFAIGDGFVTPEKPMYFFEGKSCLLIGAGTYSSANMLADAMATFKIGTLIGQPTGQWTSDFGEMAEFVLPNTKLPFTVAMTLDVGADANIDEFHPVFPDIQIENDVLTFAKDWILKQ